jgi:hypothetical protein
LQDETFVQDQPKKSFFGGPFTKKTYQSSYTLRYSRSYASLPHAWSLQVSVILQVKLLLLAEKGFILLMPTPAFAAARKKFAVCGCKSIKRAQISKTPCLGSYQCNKLPFLDTMDDVSFVLLGTLFGTAHLHS